MEAEINSDFNADLCSAKAHVNDAGEKEDFLKERSHRSQFPTRTIVGRSSPNGVEDDTEEADGGPFRDSMFAIVLTASALLLAPARGCGPNAKGGTCYSGLLFDDQPPQQLAQFEACKEDLKRDWCTIVYNEDGGEARFHCFNYYNTNPFLGAPMCGDDTHSEVNSGGCKRMRWNDGRYCLVCCCRGANCNNPSMFRLEQQRYQSGQIGWKSANRYCSGYLVTLFISLLLLLTNT
uniref:Uncharacterized protein n=1 Tax=Steinernema glaseri TaxID=37863 RepID=A0A1I7ZKS3_9BILA